MGKQAAQIAVKRERGMLVVQAIGLTPRGQKYIKGSAPIAAKSMRDPDYKAQVAAAIKQLLESDS